MPKKHPKFILVAEDDKYYARVYQLKLAKENFDVQVVKNGAEAVEAAKARTPDLILLDLIMPVQDGFETLRQLKADKKLAAVKTIVFSNLGQDDDMRRAKELGADDYLVKANISVQEMVEKIKAAL